MPSLLIPLQNKPESASPSGTPISPLTVSKLVQELQAAYQTTTGGKFTEALSSFRHILYSSLFVVATTKSEMNEVSFLSITSLLSFF